MNRSFTGMPRFPFGPTMTSYRLFGQSEREFKDLRKKYRTLPDDLERFCKFTLNLEADKAFPASNKNYALLHKAGSVSIFKARMACVSLHGNKFRVVYARYSASIEFIVIELYTKNQKEREDKQRIEEYVKQFHTE